MKISRTATGLLAVAMLAFVASDVMAQRGGGRDGGGDREGGGRGGPGGQRGGPGGGRGGPGGFGGFGGSQDMTFALLRVEAVQEDIELMPDQEDALKKLNEQAGQRERPDFDFRNASEEERTAFFEKMRKQRDEANEKRKEQLEEVLLPEQMDRLHQINIQVQGVGALRNDEVAKELKITDAQKKEMEEARNSMRGDEAREKMQEIFRSGDRDAMREAFTKMQKEVEEKVLGALTSDQRKQFDEMKGEEFKMPEGGVRALFGGGRGGPGGGRGGPGGGRGGFGGGDRGGDGGGRGGDGGRERRRPAAEE